MSLAMATRIKGLQKQAQKIAPRKVRRHKPVNMRKRWLSLARSNQLPPVGEWLVWLILAGRGFGKTRTGAETIAQWARETKKGRFALIGQTFADARDVMVEGESGLLSVLDPSELRGGTVDSAWNRSLGELYLKNGAKFKIYSSEKPRQLRGPQHHGAWGDEPATWNDADRGTADDTTWSNLLFGLRLGSDPRIVLTGTPRPVRLVRELLKEADTAVTKGSTYDNIGNLAATFKKKVLEKYEGTRLGRQELDGELLEDTPGALWNYGIFNREGFRLRFEELPELVRVVVGVDPQAAQGSGAETGIVVAGRGVDGHAYVMGDVSGDFSPTEWATTAVDAYDYHRADAIVPERNNGGDMVETTVRTIRKNVAVKTVWASRGKQTRAEPVSLLYQQGKVHHVGVFKDLEDQMTTWVPGEKSPDRLDACFVAGTLITTDSGEVPIEAIKPGMLVLTRQGYRPVVRAEMTKQAAEVFTLQASNGASLTGTGNHPIWVQGKGFTSMDALVWGDILEICQENLLCSMGSSITASQTHPAAPFGFTFMRMTNLCGELVKMLFIGLFGCITMAQYQQGIISTTKMETPLITHQRTWNLSALHFIQSFMHLNSEIFAAPILSAFGLLPQRGTVAQKLKQCIRALVENPGKIVRLIPASARIVDNPFKLILPTPAFAHALALTEMLSSAVQIMKSESVKAADKNLGLEEVSPTAHAPVSVLGLSESGQASVYNLEVDDVHEYYANGVLVHNCVWALTELMLLEAELPPQVQTTRPRSVSM